jgi:hypothetical protein
MMPAAIVVLREWPLTASGKLDRLALPVPDVITRTVSYRAPRTPEEEVLCGLFAEVLGVERVSIDDDFFVLGGQSVLVTQLVSRIRSVLDVDIALRTIYETPRIEELAGRLYATRSRRPPLLARPRPERLPASYGQERLWFLHQLRGGHSAEYAQPEAMRLYGPLSPDALQRALQSIFRRHEILRTRYAEVNGAPWQEIVPEMSLTVAVEELSDLSPAAQAAQIQAVLQAEAAEPFDLARGPMLRVRLLRLAAEEHVLVRTVHHIASDGWSQAVFNRELLSLYNAYRQERPDPLPPLPIQYADFAVWQREWLEGGPLQEGLSYWVRQLAGVPDFPVLPADRPRPPRQTFVAEVHYQVIPAEIVEGVKTLSQRHHATAFMTLLAAFAVVMARHTGRRDVVIGSVIANRPETQLENLIGFFANTLVLRLQVQPLQTFAALLRDTRRVTLDAYRYQDVPFERVVEAVAPVRRLDVPPLFQVGFSLQNVPAVIAKLTDVVVERVPNRSRRVRVELEVDVWERNGRFEVTWAYNRDLFDGWRIAQLALHYVRVLTLVLDNPDQPTWRISLLDPAERRELLDDRSATG